MCSVDKWHRGRCLKTALLLVLALSVAGSKARAAEEKTITARRITLPIKLDGQLDEADWALAVPVSDFVQADPNEGKPASEQTEVRVLFDKDNLYFGIYCYDSEPDKILVNDLKRDFDTHEGDTFGVAIDPFHDHRNAFSFFTNAAASINDTQGLSDGRVTNLEWDGIWYSAARTQENGWTSEMIVPFKTLGFRSKKDLTMGINFKRRIRRKNENVYWSLVPRRFGVLRVSMAGALLGLDEVSGGHNLRVKPFATITSSKEQAGATKDDDFQLEAGLDVKYRVTQGLTLDATYNTDFSQVEVDTEQINLTRFSLFFPEKRDFFLENAGMFHFGDNPGERSATRGGDTQLFYSRRIGLSAAGRPLPLLGGARLSGRAGPFILGFLNIHQEESEGNHSNNFTVARVSRDILGNSDIGAILVNRDGGKAGDYNRAYGVDLNLQFRQEFSLTSFIAGTQSPGVGNKNLETKIFSKWDNGFWSTRLLFAEIGENFRPEVGFVPRTGVRNYQLNVDMRPRPGGNSYIREFNPNANIKYYTDRNNLTLTKDSQVEMLLLFRDGGQFSISYNPLFERLAVPFNIRSGVTIPAGDYFNNEWRVSYSSDRSRLLSGSARHYWGSFWDGYKKNGSYSARLSLRPHLSATVSYSYNVVDVKAGSFRADLYTLRLNYSFNPRMFVDAFLQYNTDTGKLLTNLRFNLIHRPLSDISIVLTENRASGSSPDVARALILKYTHLLQF